MKSISLTIKKTLSLGISDFLMSNKYLIFFLHLYSLTE